MVPLAAALIAMGFTCLYFAFLGWFGSANRYQSKEPDDSRNRQISDRRDEFAPLAARRYTDLFDRLRPPLVVIGVGSCGVGSVLLLVALRAG